LASALAGCASQPPLLRDQALATLEQVKGKGGATLLPAEYKSLGDAFEKGEALLKAGEGEDAESYYYLVLQKGSLLEKEVHEEKARRVEAARLAQELKRKEEERRAAQEARRRARAQAEALSLAQKEASKSGKAQKERPQVYSYTVRRGETLPLIASQPEVYSDRNLWPLIYRANRDQISDPRHIWPGQVLQIPRKFGRDEIAEAHRYAQERPLH
jgi:nucleoid-associated protein YgaU